MNLLEEDIFSRGGGSRSTAVRTGISFFVLVFAAIALLVLSRLQHGFIQQLRTGIESVLAPVLNIAILPAEPFRKVGREVTTLLELTQEVERLREENQRLKVYETRARELERRVAGLEQLTKAVAETPAASVSARVLAHGTGPFVQIAMINAGSTHGVRSGYPVVNGEGLVGRIVSVGPRTSRLLLLTDINSRVPVVVGDRQIRGILTGDNSIEPPLAYLPKDARPQIGEIVYTSGIGGLFPRGLRIGQVVGAADDLRVKTDARLNEIEYVNIVFHQSAALDLASDEARPYRSPRAAPRSAEGETGRNR